MTFENKITQYEPEIAKILDKSAKLITITGNSVFGD